MGQIQMNVTTFQSKALQAWNKHEKKKMKLTPVSHLSFCSYCYFLPQITSSKIYVLYPIGKEKGKPHIFPVNDFIKIIFSSMMLNVFLSLL
jgi:hypothetical protein